MHYFSPLNAFMRKGKDPDPDPHLWLMDPDLGGPKACGSCGSGSLTLEEALIVTLIDEVRKGMRSSSLSDSASCSRSRKQRITPDQQPKLVRLRSDSFTEHFVMNPVQNILLRIRMQNILLRIRGQNILLRIWVQNILLRIRLLNILLRVRVQNILLQIRVQNILFQIQVRGSKSVPQ